MRKYVQYARVEWSECVVEDGDEDEGDLEDDERKLNRYSPFIPFFSFIQLS